MANTNFVCFACRTVRRHPSWTTNHRCQFCAQALHFSYHKFRIPAKVDLKGWKAHQVRVYAFNAEARARNIAAWRQRIAAVAETIAATDRRNAKHLAALRERIRGYEKQLKRWAEWQ
jgi:hypothetical protein